jgi:hypothetical protein
MFKEETSSELSLSSKVFEAQGSLSNYIAHISILHHFFKASLRDFMQISQWAPHIIRRIHGRQASTLPFDIMSSTNFMILKHVAIPKRADVIIVRIKF